MEVVLWFLAASDFPEAHLLAVGFMWDHRGCSRCVQTDPGILALCEAILSQEDGVCEGDLHVSIGDSHLLESHMAVVKLTRTHCAEGQSSISISICKIMKKYCSSLFHWSGVVFLWGGEAAFPYWGWDWPYCFTKSVFLQHEWLSLIWLALQFKRLKDSWALENNEKHPSFVTAW